MKRAPTLTKRQRRELDSVPPQRLQRPRTLTRMVTPAAPPPPAVLPEGWLRCPNCKLESQISALFTLQLVEPPITTNDADELIPNPEAGKVALSGHMCPMCQSQIWPE